MAKNKHVLGLHTEKERKHAYGLVNRIYRVAMLKETSRYDATYALGYVEAVIDLLNAEAPAEANEELGELLMKMRSDLLEKSAIEFPG
jgi:hypothetical protein